MATWTALTFAYGSKLTSTKMTQLQDNFTALSEQASSSPVMFSPTSGMVYTFFNAPSEVTHVGAFTAKKSAQFLRSGNVTVDFLLKGLTAGANDIAYARVYIDGVNVGSSAVGSGYANGAGSYTRHSETFSLGNGALIQLWTACTSGPAYLKEFKLMSANPIPCCAMVSSGFDW